MKTRRNSYESGTQIREGETYKSQIDLTTVTRSTAASDTVEIRTAPSIKAMKK